MSRPIARQRLRRAAVVSLLLAGGCAAPAIGSSDSPAGTVVAQRPPASGPNITPAASPVPTSTSSPVPTTVAGDAPATPTTTAAANRRPAPTGPPRNSVFCGPTLQDVRSRAKAVADIIARAGIVELRPPCVTRYGRKSTGELVYAGRMNFDPGIVRDNKTMLAFALANHCRYYVDDVRFISGDPALVSAAFDDYRDDLYSGLFGIELPDEPTVAVLEQNLTIIRQLAAELARRNASSGQQLALTDIVRPSVNYVPGSDKVIPALREALGPTARFSMDAYTTDEKIWRDIMGLYGIVDGVAAPGTAYDIQLTVPISRWFDRKTDEPRSPEVTLDTVTSYVGIAASYRSAGVTGVMLFTGFAAEDNFYEDHFQGTLLQRKVLDTLLDVLDRYREVASG